jgi:hypothetical protein
MKYKKVIIFLVTLVILINLASVSNWVRADEKYGIVSVNGVEMYKDTYGNLFPIIDEGNGRKYVQIGNYELEPLEVLMERDAKESKGKSALPEDILRKYYSSKDFSISAYSYVTLSSIYSYNQRYQSWGSTTLGFGPDTIAQSGCFLTSCAMMLATYNLTINGSLVNPLNLNTWLKDFQHSPSYNWPDYPNESGGFGPDVTHQYHDLLKFSAIASFPGINSIGAFDDFYPDASIAIYYQKVPILRMSPEHYSPLVKTNGEKNRDNNWIMNTYRSGYPTYDYNTNLGRVYSPYTGVPYYQTVTQSGYNFASSSLFRIAFPN